MRNEMFRKARVECEDKKLVFSQQEKQKNIFQMKSDFMEKWKMKYFCSKVINVII